MSSELNFYFIYYLYFKVKDSSRLQLEFSFKNLKVLIIAQSNVYRLDF